MKITYKCIVRDATKCKFESLLGHCDKYANYDEFCEEHSIIMCTCGKKAIGLCYDGTSMICGTPTCLSTLFCHSHSESREHQNKYYEEMKKHDK